MATGSVMWFNDKRGYGFIKDDDGNSIFIRCSEINANRDKSLSAKDRVSFDVKRVGMLSKAINTAKIQF